MITCSSFKYGAVSKYWYMDRNNRLIIIMPTNRQENLIKEEPITNIIFQIAENPPVFFLLTSCCFRIDLLFK